MQNGHNLFDDDDERAGRDLVLSILGANAASLLRLARGHSLCADDAYDAYQRAVEILLRRAGGLEPATANAWMRTVVKHEAMAVRAERQSLLAREEVDLDARPAPAPSEEEQVERFDRLAAAAEALQSLKPQEVQALVLKAEGHSYREIGERMGWTYTKVNRLLTEGRASFRDRYEAIASGAECERWAPVLSRLADGEATVRELVQVRRHLRRCPGCRATLRAYRDAPSGITAVVPLVAVTGVVSASGPDGAVAGALETLGGGLGWQERVTLGAGKLQAAAEAATSSKVAAVAASTAALAGGGAVVDRVTHHDAAATAAVRARVEALARPAPTPPPERTSDPQPAAPPDAVEPSERPEATSPAAAPPRPAPPTAPAPEPAPRADDFGVEASSSPARAASSPSSSSPSPSSPPAAAPRGSSTSHAPAEPAGSPGGEFGP